ncbi:MAG: carbohydrate ABC transporter substrate-binding protein [Spirochaetes bacterium]|nr:MAG: carbohydrate ABC transporter substrate-binding protein [Spirochaetota bacterium]
MKKITIIAVVLLLFFSPSFLFSEGAKEKKVENKLEIFSWWTAGGEAEGLEAMFDIYKSKYPDVEIINATVAGGAGANAKAVLATRMQGGNPPDSFQVHAGHELIDTWVVAGKMEPITFIFKDNGWMDVYPKGVIDIISYKGEIYSVPVNIHRSNVLWYNKRIFQESGLTPPKTLDEFFQVAEKLANMGITPLALGDKNTWTSTHLLESVLLATLGPEGYKGLWDGSTPWDGSAVRKALDNFVRMLKYVNTDHAALTWDAATQYVIDGKSAMNIMGDWAEGYFKAKGLTPGKEFGWLPSPGTQGSFMMLSDSFGLPKGAPHRENAIRWLTVCGSREGQDAFNPIKGSIPSRIDGDKSLYDEYLQSAMKDFSKNAIVPSVAHGAAASEGWLTKINDIMTVFVSERNIDKAVEQFSKAARESLGK